MHVNRLDKGASIVRDLLLGWFKKTVCLGIIGITLSVTACTWIKAGEQPDTSTPVKDGRDETEIDVDGPIDSNDSAPAPNELP